MSPVSRTRRIINIRPSLRPIIANQGKIFQALNSAKFGPIPDEGYTNKNIFVDVVQDADIADSIATLPPSTSHSTWDMRIRPTSARHLPGSVAGPSTRDSGRRRSLTAPASSG